jgi:hypothetical protein
LFWGLVKWRLCLMLALLKPIVKVSKVVVTLLALFKLVKITKPIIVVFVVITIICCCFCFPIARVLLVVLWVN